MVRVRVRVRVKPTTIADRERATPCVPLAAWQMPRGDRSVPLDDGGGSGVAAFDAGAQS